MDEKPAPFAVGAEVLIAMVLKTPEPLSSSDRRKVAGKRAEEQMAHYLSREFGDDPHLYLFHDLRLEREGDAAQIDHLLFHRYGAIIVESKSVKGEVAVNSHGEWTRKWGGRAEGMASPIEQARRQGEFLRGTLQLHRDQLRGRKLFGLKQGGFQHMPIDLLVAISDGGTIRRPRSPQLPEVHKADLIPAQIKRVLSEHRRVNSLFSTSAKGGYELTKDELGRISDFLLAHHRPRTHASESPAPPTFEQVDRREAPTQSRCRHCQSDRVSIQHGPHSYYFKCASCDGNTAIREQCAACGGKKRIRKQGLLFFADCQHCGTSARYFTNPD